MKDKTLDSLHILPSLIIMSYEGLNLLMYLTPVQSPCFTWRSYHFQSDEGRQKIMRKKSEKTP